MQEPMPPTSLNEGSPRQLRTESAYHVGVQTYFGINEDKLIPKHIPRNDLLEQILSPCNLNRAYKRVVSNGGSHGVDKMKTSELLSYLTVHKDELLSSLYHGTYRPSAVRRVMIPKPDGGQRQLGIPTVVDRLIQQAIAQILSPLYDCDFSPFSYGFRQGRGAHMALRQAQKYITDGHEYVVDLDLERFFDTVNHSKLIQLLWDKIKDGRVISLIHKYLRAGFMAGNAFERTTCGVPQGGPLSPILSNVLLNELDKEVVRRGHLFVRYADDMLIFCTSMRSGERTLKHLIPFIEKKLFLKVNQKKTCVCFARQVKFLGYSFYFRGGRALLCVHPRSIFRLKDSLRSLTRRNKGGGYAPLKSALASFIVGWVSYYRLAHMQKALLRIDKWLRRRIRMVIWKLWKVIKCRYSHLVKLGINKAKALSLANARQRFWHMSDHPVIKMALTKERLNKAGYVMMYDQYRKVYEK